LGGGTLDGMPKRALAAFLWFAAAWFGYEIVWSVTGAPRLLGPMLAFLAGAFVTVDPFGRFWARTESHTAAVTPVEPSHNPA